MLPSWRATSLKGLATLWFIGTPLFATAPILRMAMYDGKNIPQLTTLSGATEATRAVLSDHLETPLGSVWKLFVYFYLTAEELSAPRYTCRGGDPQEKFCCQPYETINAEQALYRSCTPFFQPQRLKLRPSEWTRFWRSIDGASYPWLTQLDELRPDRHVKVRELVQALYALNRLKPALSKTRSVLEQVLIQGTAKGNVRSLGGMLRVKTFTWDADSSRKTMPTYLGGFAGWLADGSAIWASAEGASSRVISGWASRLAPLVERSPRADGGECVQVQFFARYPISAVTNTLGAEVTPGALQGNYLVRFRNGHQLQFRASGDIRFDRSSGQPHLSGKFDVNEYVARVLQREVDVRSAEAAKAFAIVIRSFLQQNAKWDGSCWMAPDSSHFQRVSVDPPSAAARRVSEWTDSLVMQGANVHYHSTRPAVNRLAWTEATRLAREGYYYDEILRSAFPAAKIATLISPRYHDCRRLTAAEQWLQVQSALWERRLTLNAEGPGATGFEPPATIKVCELAEGFPYVDYQENLIYARRLRQPEDRLALTHEYLHLAFQHHPRGRDQAFVERLARELTGIE